MINDSEEIWIKKKKRYLMMGRLLCSLPVWLPCFHSKCTWAFKPEFLNFLDSGNISCEHLQENRVQNEILPLRTTLQTASRIYLTLSHLLNQLEIIHDTSAMIKMERPDEEMPLFLFFLFFYKRTIELVTRLEMPCQRGPHGHRAQLLKGDKTVQLGPPSNPSQG